MGLKSQMNDILIGMIELGLVEGVKMMPGRGVSLTNLKDGKTAFHLARPRYIDDPIRTPMFNFLENNVNGKLIIHVCFMLGNIMHVFKLHSICFCLKHDSYVLRSLLHLLHILLQW